MDRKNISRKHLPLFLIACMFTTIDLKMALGKGHSRSELLAQGAGGSATRTQMQYK